MISFIDVILIVLLSGFVFYGFFFGLIRTLGNLFALIAGFWLASHFYLTIFFKIKGLFFGFDQAGKIIVFLLVFSLVNRLVVLGFSLVNRGFDLISIIPFLKTINRLTGAIFGLILGAVLVSLILHLIMSMPFIGGWIGKSLASSKIIPILSKLNSLTAPLVPKAWEKISMGKYGK